MARTQKARKLSLGGSPAEPQTAKKAEAAERPPSPAAEEDDEPESEEAEEEDRECEECGVCYEQAVVEASDGELYCRRHEVQELLLRGKRERGRQAAMLALGLPTSAKQLRREKQLARLERRRAAGLATDSDSESSGLRSRMRAPRQLARETLRVRYVLRTAHAEDVMRALRTAVYGTDDASTAVVRALASALPPTRFPPEPQQLAKCARCKARFNPAYPAAEACCVAHKGTVYDDDYGAVMRCKRCHCKFRSRPRPGDSAWCFVGSHTTSRRRALCENDGDCTPVEQSALSGDGDGCDEEEDDDCDDCDEDECGSGSGCDDDDDEDGSSDDEECETSESDSDEEEDEDEEDE